MEIHKAKIYLDSGADITFLKSYYSKCHFFTSWYDSPHHRKKKPQPTYAQPSAVKWKDGHITWKEANWSWSECEGSPIRDNLEDIVGPNNQQDICHLDSAYKEQVDVFLTSDKHDIWSKRKAIESCTGFKILHTPSEKLKTIEAITNILNERQN